MFKEWLKRVWSIQSQKNRAILYILIATFFFSLMNICVKYLSRIPAYEVAFFRALISLVLLLFVFLYQRKAPWGHNKPILLLRGLAGTIALVLYFYTVQRMPLSSAVTIQYLSPIFTVLLAGAIFKEWPRPLQWLFFALAFGGVILVKGVDPRVSVTDALIGVVSAVFSGCAYNFIRKLKDSDNPLVVVFYFVLVTSVILGLYSVFHWVPPLPQEWVILVLIGIFTTIMQVFMTMAYQTGKAADVSIFNYLGTLFAIGLGYLLFSETVEPLAFAGIILILVGVILSTRFKSPAEPLLG